MRHVFVVSPTEGAWCLKIDSTREVMFFKTCGMAERRALSLAAQAIPSGGESEVQVRDYGGRLIGRWIKNQFHQEPATDKHLRFAA